jgi:ribosomal protein L17
MLHKTSTFFNIIQANTVFYTSILKMQSRLHDAVSSNRAKLNYLQIIWEEGLQKLIFDLAKKNSKKKGEYSTIIA